MYCERQRGKLRVGPNAWNHAISIEIFTFCVKPRLQWGANEIDRGKRDMDGGRKRWSENENLSLSYGAEFGRHTVWLENVRCFTVIPADDRHTHE